MLKKYAKWRWVGWVMLCLLGSGHGPWAYNRFYFEGQLWDAVSRQPVEGTRNVTIEVMSGLVNNAIGAGTQVRWSRRIPYQFDSGFIWVEIGNDVPLDATALLSPNPGVAIEVAGVSGKAIYPIRPIPSVAWAPLTQQALSVTSRGIQGPLGSRSVVGSYPDIREMGPLTGLRVGGVVATASPPRLGIGVGVPAMGLDVANGIRIRTGNLQFADGSVLKTGSLSRPSVGVGNTGSVRIDADTDSVGRGLSFRSGKVGRMGVASLGEVWVGDPPVAGPLLSVGGGMLIGPVTGPTPGSIQFAANMFWGYGEYGWVRLDVQPMVASSWQVANPSVMPRGGLEKWGIGVRMPSTAIQVAGPVRANVWAGAVSGNGTLLSGLTWSQVRGVAPIERGGLGAWVTRDRLLQVTQNQMVGLKVGLDGWVLGSTTGLLSPTVSMGNGVVQQMVGTQLTWSHATPSVSLGNQGVESGWGFSSLQVTPYGHVVGATPSPMDDRYPLKESMDFLYIGGSVVRLTGSLRVTALQGTIIMDRLGTTVIRIGTSNARQRVSVAGALRVSDNANALPGSIQFNRTYDWLEGWGPQGWRRLDSPANERAGWQRNGSVLGFEVGRVGIATANPTHALTVSGSVVVSGTAQMSSIQAARLGIGQHPLGPGQWRGGDWAVGELHMRRWAIDRTDMVIPTLRSQGLRVGEYRVTPGAQVVIRDGLQTRVWQVGHWDSPDIRMGPFRWWNGEWGMKEGLRIQFPVEMPTLLVVPRVSVGTGVGIDTLTIKDRQVAIQRPPRYNASGLNVSGDMVIGGVGDQSLRSTGSDVILAGHLIVGGTVLNADTQLGMITVSQSATLAQDDTRVVTIGTGAAVLSPPVQAKWVVHGDEGQSVLDWQSGGAGPAVFMDEQGRMGIGVTDPTAFLTIRASTETTPAWQITPGNLLTQPLKGSLEITDGFYFTPTQNSRRSVWLTNRQMTGASVIGSSNIEGGVLTGARITGVWEWPAKVTASDGWGITGGWVGVNQPNPQATLDVMGAIRVKGAPLVPGSMGVNGGVVVGRHATGEVALTNQSDRDVWVLARDMASAHTMANMGLMNRNPQVALSVTGTVSANQLVGTGRGIRGLTQSQFGGMVTVAQGGVKRIGTGEGVLTGWGGEALRAVTMNQYHVLGMMPQIGGIAVVTGRGMQPLLAMDGWLFASVARPEVTVAQLAMPDDQIWQQLTLDEWGQVLGMSSQSLGSRYASNGTGLMRQDNAVVTNTVRLMGQPSLRTTTGDLLVRAKRVGVGTTQPMQPLDIKGAIRMASDNPTVPGTIRYQEGRFEGRNTTTWLPLDVMTSTIKSADYLVGDGSLLTGLSHDYARLYRTQGGLDWPYWVSDTVIYANQDGELTSIYLPAYRWLMMTSSGMMATEWVVSNLQKGSSNTLSHLPYLGSGFPTLAGDAGIASISFDSLGRPMQITTRSYDIRYYTKSEVWGKVFPVSDQIWSKSVVVSNPSVLTTEGGSLIIQPGGRGQVGWGSIRPEALLSIGDGDTPIEQSVAFEIGGRAGQGVNKEGVKWLIQGVSTQNPVTMIQAQSDDGMVEMALMNRRTGIRSSGLYVAGNMAVGNDVQTTQSGVLTAQAFVGDGSQLTNIGIDNIGTVASPTKGGLGAGSYPVGGVLVGRGIGSVGGMVLGAGDLLMGTGDLPQAGRVVGQTGVGVNVGSGVIRLALSQSISPTSRPTFNAMTTETLTVPYWQSEGDLSLPRRVSLGRTPPEGVAVWVSGNMNARRDMVILQGVSIDGTVALPTMAVTQQAIVPLLGNIPAPLLEGVRPIEMAVTMNVVGVLRISGSGGVSAQHLSVLPDRMGPAGVMVTDRLTIRDTVSANRVTVRDAFRFNQNMMVVKAGEGVGIGREVASGLTVSGNVGVSGGGDLETLSVRDPLKWAGEWFQVTADGVGWGDEPVGGVAVSGNVRGHAWWVQGNVTATVSVTVGAGDLRVVQGKAGIGTVPQSPLDVSGDMTVSDQVVVAMLSAKALDYRAQRLVVTDNKVGVGVAVPTAVLDVQGEAWWRGSVREEGSQFVINNGQVGIGTWTPQGEIEIQGTAETKSARALTVVGTVLQSPGLWADTRTLTVGVASSNPRARLGIQGNARITQMTSVSAGVSTNEWQVDQPNRLWQVQSSGVGIKRIPSQWLSVSGTMKANKLVSKALTVTKNMVIGSEWAGVQVDVVNQKMGIGMVPNDHVSVSGNMAISGAVGAKQLTAEMVSVNRTTLVVAGTQVGMGRRPDPTASDIAWDVQGDVQVSQGGESQGVSVNGTWQVGGDGGAVLLVNADDARVGVGLDRPGDRLGVSGNMRITGQFEMNDGVTAQHSLRVGNIVVATVNRVGIDNMQPATTLDVGGLLRVGRVSLNAEWVIRSTLMVTPNQAAGPVLRVSNAGLGIRRLTPLQALDVAGDGRVSHQVMGDRLTVGVTMKVGDLRVDQAGVQLGAIPRDGKTLVGSTAKLTGHVSVGQMTGATQWVLNEVVTLNPTVWSIDASQIPEKGMGVSGNMWVTGTLRAARFSGDGSGLTGLLPVYPSNTSAMTGLWQGVLGLTIPQSGDIPVGVGGEWRPNRVIAVPQKGVTVNRDNGRVRVSLVEVNQFNGVNLTGLITMNNDPKLIYDGVNGTWPQVGIGTTGPLVATLDVNGSGRYSRDLRVGNNWIDPIGKVGVGQPPSNALDVRGDGRLSGGVRVGNQMVMGGPLSVADGVWVGTRNGADRVGIGTTEPAHHLDIRGDWLISGRLWGVIPKMGIVSGVINVFEARNAINLAGLVSANQQQSPFWVALNGATTYRNTMTLLGSMAVTTLKVGGTTLWVSPNQTIGINQAPVTTNALTVSGDLTISEGVTVSSLTVAMDGALAKKGVLIQSTTKQWQLFHQDGSETAMVGGDVALTGDARALAWGGDGSLLTQLDATQVTTGYWGSMVGGIEDVSLAGMESEGARRWLGVSDHRVVTLGGNGWPTTQTVGWRRHTGLGQLQLTLPQSLWQTNQPTFNQLTLKTRLQASKLTPSGNRSIRFNVPSVGIGRVNSVFRWSVAGDTSLTGNMTVGTITLASMPRNEQLVIGGGSWGSGLLVNGSSRVSGDVMAARATANQLVMPNWWVTNPSFGSVGIGRKSPSRKVEVSGNIMITGGVVAGSLVAVTVNTAIARVGSLNDMPIRDKVTMTVATINQFEMTGEPRWILNQTGDVTSNIWRVSNLSSQGYLVDPSLRSDLNQLTTNTLKGHNDSFVFSGPPLSATLNQITASRFFLNGVSLKNNELTTFNQLAVNELWQGDTRVVDFPVTPLNTWQVSLQTATNTTSSRPANNSLEQRVVFSHPLGDAAWLTSTVNSTQCPVSRTGSTYSGPIDPRWEMPCLVAVSANVAAPGFVTVNITTWPTANRQPPVFSEAEFGESGDNADRYPLGGIIQAKHGTVNVTMNRLIDGVWVPVHMPIIQSLTGVGVDQSGTGFNVGFKIMLTEPGVYSFEVPDDIGYLDTKVVGAGGGAGGYGRTLSAVGNKGAGGGVVNGRIPVLTGQTITVYVGGGGWGGMDSREAIFVGRPQDVGPENNSVYLLSVGGGGGFNGGGPGGHSVGPEQGGVTPTLCDTDPNIASPNPYVEVFLDANNTLTTITNADYYISTYPYDNRDVTFRQSWGQGRYVNGNSYTVMEAYSSYSRASGRCPANRSDGIPDWRTGGGGGGGGGWSGVFVNGQAYMIAGGGGGGHGGHTPGNSARGNRHWSYYVADPTTIDPATLYPSWCGTSLFCEGLAMVTHAQPGGERIASNFPDSRTEIEMAGGVGRSFFWETNQSIGGGGGGGGGALGGVGETWEKFEAGQSVGYRELLGRELFAEAGGSITRYIKNEGGSSYVHPNVMSPVATAGGAYNGGYYRTDTATRFTTSRFDSASQTYVTAPGNFYGVTAGPRRKGGDGSVEIQFSGTSNRIDPNRITRMPRIKNTAPDNAGLRVVNQSAMYGGRGYRPFDWVIVTQPFDNGERCGSPSAPSNCYGGKIPYLTLDVRPAVINQDYRSRPSNVSDWCRKMPENNQLPCVFANQTQDTLKDANNMGVTDFGRTFLDTRLIVDDLALTGNQYGPTPLLMPTPIVKNLTVSLNRLRVGAEGATYYLDSQARATPTSPKGFGQLRTVSVNVLAKTSGSFDIPHPQSNREGVRLRHYFVETPSPGGNVYKWQGMYPSGDTWVALPDYMAHLNENTMVQLSPVGHFGEGWGEVIGHQLHVVVSESGRYNVLLFGTRKDPGALDVFSRFGTEYRVRDDQSIERIK